MDDMELELSSEVLAEPWFGCAKTTGHLDLRIPFFRGHVGRRSCVSATTCQEFSSTDISQKKEVPTGSSSNPLIAYSPCGIVL